jgi:hypothetical protein
MSSTSFDLPERPGSDWFRDEEGVLTTSKHRDEVLPVTLDVSESLPSGVTISSVAWKDQGVTTSLRANSTTTVSANVTGTDGSFAVTITLSSGAKLVRTRRFLGVPDGRRRSRDYP